MSLHGHQTLGVLFILLLYCPLLSSILSKIAAPAPVIMLAFQAVGRIRRASVQPYAFKEMINQVINGIFNRGKRAEFNKRTVDRSVNRIRRKVTKYLGLSVGRVITTTRPERTRRAMESAIAIVKAHPSGGLAFSARMHHANLQPGIRTTHTEFFSNDYFYLLFLNEYFLF